jgi:diguanylate cyclase (GGDEF)-like protein
MPNDEWDDDDLTGVASRAELAAALAGQAKTQRPWLVVVNGRTSVGKTYKLDVALVIGRAPQCDVHLDEDGISRRHARLLRRDDGSVHIEDLSSRNGTFVNGERVETYALRDGDKIQIGTISILKFSYQDAFDEALQKNLYESATRDPLTKIANKKTFADTMERECAYATRHRSALSLLLFDVDHFKKVNDTFGHPAGDYVLHALARTVEKCVRAEDLFARVGGEEFAIVLRDLDDVQAVVCAERVRNIVESTELVHDGKRIPITISIGAATHAPTRATPAALVEAADKLLYRAKQEGRNRVVSSGRAG